MTPEIGFVGDERIVCSTGCLGHGVSLTHLNGRLIADLLSDRKTTTPEFGLTGTTEAVAYGPTHNPWKLGFTPGGSSGGSSALVAAGVLPIAHANDGAGSIRVPASCCGLVGLKPTRGRFAAVEGSGLLPINILHQGVVTRSVRDTVAFVHGAERYHRNPRLPAVGLVSRPGRRGLRIGFFTGLVGHKPADEECVAAVEGVAKVCESLGHTVEPIRAPLVDGFHRAFFLLWAAMAFIITRFGKQLIHPEFDRTKVEDLTEGLATHFKSNAPPFTPIQNVSGGPAISLPLAQSKAGLPIGVQFASAVGDESTLLQLALELEEASPWPRLGAS